MNEDYSLHQLRSKMHQLQNQSIDPETAQHLHNQQITGLKQALDQGLSLLKAFEHNQLSEDSPYREWLSQHRLFHQHIQQDPNFYLKQPEQFKLQQRKLYQLLDHPNIDENYALFFELMLGYTRFDILVQSARTLFDFLNDKYQLELALPSTRQSNTFFERLANVSNAADYLHTALSELYLDQLSAETYWQDIKQLFDTNQHLKALAKILFCMQYKPKDTNRISMAQLLHFNGNGGDFDLLKNYAELVPLAKHALNIHGTQSDTLSKFDNTALFKPIYSRLSRYVSNTLSDFIRRHFAAGDTLEIYDLGCGSTCQGILPTISQCDEYTFTITASDVDFNSLERVTQMRPPCNCSINDVRMDDLNQPLNPRNRDIDRFDICSASIVMHQLFPEQQLQIMRYLVQVTKPGGLISNPDANADTAYKQIYVLPINTIDREGCVDWAPVASTCVDVEQPHLIKVALPLFDLSYPDTLSPYACYFYQVHLVDKSILTELCMATESRDQQRIHELLNKHCYSKT